MASKLSCSYCHNVQSKAGLACSSFTNFQFVSGKKVAVFSSRKKGETQVSRYGKKAMPSFLLFFFPITIFSSAVFCSLDACLLRLLYCSGAKGQAVFQCPKRGLKNKNLHLFFLFLSINTMLFCGVGWLSSLSFECKILRSLG